MLNVTRLRLGYGHTCVLDFPGMTLDAGSQCLITGPSGSGKTTLLYALAGLSGVMEGKITLHGTEITALSEAQRDHFRGQHIGVIFQTLHLVKSLSVLDNLMLASYVAGIKQDTARAHAVLKQLDILNKKDELPERLSQGQAQRVAIARAILHKPSLIIADEPTSSLDDTACENVMELILTAAQDTNAALVISTHDQRIKSHFSHVIDVRAAA